MTSYTTVSTDDGIISTASSSICISTNTMENNIDDLIQIGPGTGLFLCILTRVLLSASTRKQTVKCSDFSYIFSLGRGISVRGGLECNPFFFNCVRTEQACKIGEAVQRSVPWQNLDHCFMHAVGSWRSSSSSFNY